MNSTRADSSVMMKVRKSEDARVRMDPTLKMRLQQLAMIQALDLSDVIRMACMAYVAKAQQPFA